jgi:hypothetical protein
MYRFRQWRRERAARKGKASWGRLPDPPTGHVKSKMVGTLVVKVIRANGEVEEQAVPAILMAHGDSSN